jgi:glycosyltransferase involved in cell wall biosynthesis
VVESLAVGTPVITGNIGDRSTMLADGALGILVEPGDSRSLAQGIVALLQAPELRAQMTQASLSRREEWYWDRLAYDFARIYTGSVPDRNDR